VSVYLPLAQEGAEVLGREGWGEQEAERGNFERVLVVEEEEELRKDLSSMLAKLNYDAVFASSGEALEIPATERFDIVLVDVVLPKMSGDELIERLKQGRGDARFILLTENERSPGGAADSVIKKPFSLETLALSLKASLENDESEGRTIH